METKKTQNKKDNSYKSLSTLISDLLKRYNNDPILIDILAKQIMYDKNGKMIGFDTDSLCEFLDSEEITAPVKVKIKHILSLFEYSTYSEKDFQIESQLETEEDMFLEFLLKLCSSYSVPKGIENNYVFKYRKLREHGIDFETVTEKIETEIIENYFLIANQ